VFESRGFLSHVYKSLSLDLILRKLISVHMLDILTCFNIMVLCAVDVNLVAEDINTKNESTWRLVLK
jgi:hypothetical protein